MGLYGREGREAVSGREGKQIKDMVPDCYCWALLLSRFSRSNDTEGNVVEREMAVRGDVEPGFDGCHFCCSEGSNSAVETYTQCFKLVKRSRKASEHLLSIVELEQENLKLFKASPSRHNVVEGSAGLIPLSSPSTSPHSCHPFSASTWTASRKTSRCVDDLIWLMRNGNREFGECGVQLVWEERWGNGHAMPLVAISSADGWGSPISNLELLYTTYIGAVRVVASSTNFTFILCRKIPTSILFVPPLIVKVGINSNHGLPNIRPRPRCLRLLSY